jgi:hypothetical protein
VASRANRKEVPKTQGALISASLSAAATTPVGLIIAGTIIISFFEQKRVKSS